MVLLRIPFSSPSLASLSLYYASDKKSIKSLEFEISIFFVMPIKTFFHYRIQTARPLSWKELYFRQATSSGAEPKNNYIYFE